MSNYGFIDARSSAELMLAPATPLKRILQNSSALKLDIGGLGGIPGAIQSASQITGAVRGTFSAAAVAQSMASSMGGALSATYSEAAKGLSVSATVDPMFAQNTGVTVDVPGISASITPGGVGASFTLPSSDQFLQMSSLRPGQIPGVAQMSMINDRVNQISGLASSLFGMASDRGGLGVSLMERTQKFPYPLADQLNIPSFPRLTTGGKVAQAEAILQDKVKFVVRGVRVASGKPSFWSRLRTMVQAAVQPTLNNTVGQVFRDAVNSGGWSEPGPPYAAQYPYNKATHTESGHIWEMDDTPGAERIHIFHRSGSFIEMHPDGSAVYKNMKHGYMLTMGDQHVKVSGDCHINVEGSTTIYSKGDVQLESDGEINMSAKEDFNVFARNINLRSKIKFTADGQIIDLRYILLPFMVIPVYGALVPMVNLAAMRLDFPTGTFDQVVMESLKGPLDEGILPGLLKFQTDAEALAGNTQPTLLPETPLANPATYMKTGAAAVAYRARLFDTPEETEKYDLYTAHIGLQQTLGDVSGDDPRQLGGKVRDLDTSRNVDVHPIIDYLSFEDFAGKFVYSASQSVGNTSFTFGDLVDTEHASDAVEPKKTALDASVELGKDAGQAGPMTANNTALTIQGIMGSDGVSGGLPTQNVATTETLWSSKKMPERGFSPWPS